jgi:hypothetical protein
MLWRALCVGPTLDLPTMVQIKYEEESMFVKHALSVYLWRAMGIAIGVGPGECGKAKH